MDFDRATFHRPGQQAIRPTIGLLRGFLTTRPLTSCLLRIGGVAEDLCWIFSTPNLTPFRSAESRDRCGSFEGLMQAAIGCTMLSARETPTQHAMDCRAWRKRRPLSHTLACQLPPSVGEGAECDFGCTPQSDQDSTAPKLHNPIHRNGRRRCAQ